MISSLRPVVEKFLFLENQKKNDQMQSEGVYYDKRKTWLHNLKENNLLGSCIKLLIQLSSHLLRAD